MKTYLKRPYEKPLGSVYYSSSDTVYQHLPTRVSFRARIVQPSTKEQQRLLSSSSSTRFQHVHWGKYGIKPIVPSEDLSCEQWLNGKKSHKRRSSSIGSISSRHDRNQCFRSKSDLQKKSILPSISSLSYLAQEHKTLLILSSISLLLLLLFYIIYRRRYVKSNENKLHKLLEQQQHRQNFENAFHHHDLFEYHLPSINVLPTIVEENPATLSPVNLSNRFTLLSNPPSISIVTDDNDSSNSSSTILCQPESSSNINNQTLTKNQNQTEIQKQIQNPPQTQKETQNSTQTEKNIKNPLQAQTQKQIPTDTEAQKQIPIPTETQKQTQNPLKTQKEVQNPSQNETQKQIPIPTETQKQTQNPPKTQKEVQNPPQKQISTQKQNQIETQKEVQNPPQNEIQKPNSTQKQNQTETQKPIQNLTKTETQKQNEDDKKNSIEKPSVVKNEQPAASNLRRRSRFEPETPAKPTVDIPATVNEPSVPSVIVRKSSIPHQNVIKDDYSSLEEINDAVKQVGLLRSQLIFGIDYTISNLETGKNSFNGLSLHHIQDGLLNPYQSVITIVGRTLEKFDSDSLIPVFGFGDRSSLDRKIFPLRPDGSYCKGFRGVLEAYNEITPKVRMSGPTNFAPLIREAIRIVKKTRQYHILVIVADGQVTNEKQTKDAIVEASSYPLSIVMIGVGDGPWDMMEEFDDSLPTRQFDNFQFVNYNSIVEASTNTDSTFALHALMEIPSQYAQIKNLGLLKDS